MGTEHVKSGPTQPALGPWHGRAITKPRRARGQVGDLGVRIQQGCARRASLEDMARRAASFVLNEPGSRHLTPPPSRTLFPVCPSRAGHGEREPATWGAEPPLLRTNLQARAACGRPAVKAPDAGTDSTTRHSPRVPSTRNGPGAPQSLSAAAGAGAWGPPAVWGRGHRCVHTPRRPPVPYGARGRGRPAHGCPSRPQEQFEFALTAVAEEVNAILQALPQ